MYKHLLIALFISVFSFGTLLSQTSHKAVFLRLIEDHYVQDTIEILYANRFSANGKEWIDCVFKGKLNVRRRKFKADRLTFLSEPTTFWGQQYFWNRKLPTKLLISGQIPPKNDQKEHFKMMAYHPQLPTFKDVILEDYLEKKLREVFTKEDEAQFNLRPYIKIVKHEMPLNVALKSGCLVFSTGLLAQVYTEDELYALLVSELAHLLFNHLAEGLVGDNTEKIRNRYSLPDLLLADKMTKEWLTSKGKNPDSWGFLLDRIRQNQFFLQADLTPESDFHRVNIARYYPHLLTRLNGMYFNFPHQQAVAVPDLVMDIRLVEVIENQAFLMRGLKQYDRSLSLINRIIKLEIAGADHFMMKADLLQKLYPDGVQDKLVLAQLRMAKELEPMVDRQIYEEEIRLLIRLDQKEEAILILDELDDKLQESETTNENVSIANWSKEMRKRLIRALREKELIQQKEIQGKG
jgi:hypothetical protein